ncbi:MAG: hypothetical protein ACRCZU_05875 [Selenomonadaceae bacterium]
MQTENMKLIELMEVMKKACYETASIEKQDAHDLMKDYFMEKLKQSNNIYTPEIIEEAKTLFCMPDYTNIVPKALNLTRAQFNKLTERKVQIECDNCSSPIIVREILYQSGYGLGSTGPYYCEKCKAHFRRQRQEEEADNEKQAYCEQMNRIENELKVLSSGDPLNEIVFMKLIEKYNKIYSDGVLEIENSLFGNLKYKLDYSGKCQICGDNSYSPYVNYSIPVDMTLVSSLEIEWTCLSQLENNVTAYSKSLERDTFPEYPKLISILQVLMRISPFVFFHKYPTVPLLAKPLIFACDSCGLFLIGNKFNKVDI